MAVIDFIWPFDLEEYTVTKDVTNDYFGRVKAKGPVTEADIAKAICEERTEFRPSTIETVQTLVAEKIRQLVGRGYSVVTGTANYMPTVSGLFIGTEGVVDPLVNKCEVSIAPSNEMRKTLSQVKLEFSGRAKSLGGARIALVRDVATDRVDGFITPGQQIDVTGIKIRCVGADGKSQGSVKLVNNETNAVAATITSLGLNTPSRLMFVVPAGLEKGTYRLEIETYFSTSTKLLKAARTLTYEMLLSVGQEPTPDDGGGDDVLS